MPFTLAHPIATLPLWKVSNRRLDLPALFVGSTIPDITYFIALRPVPNIGHSITGIFIEGVPSAIVLLLISRYLLWQPVLALLPSTIAHRLPPSHRYSFLPIHRLFNIVLSIALGALTHIVWDNFTHSYGWGVKRFSVLSTEVAQLPIYKWLQYGGGIIGLILLLLWLGSVLSQQSPQDQPPKTLSHKGKSLAWAFIGTVLSLIVYSAVSAAPSYTPTVTIVCAVIGLISGLFLGLCLYAAIFWANQAAHD